MPDCRLIIDSPAAGSWNMAVDEALLNCAASDPGWTLRFYAWSEPTLSLGYFQSHHSRGLHAASACCAMTRRLSGGGAIMHDQEITYSLIAPISHRLAQNAEVLYSEAHRAWIGALASLHVAGCLHEPEAGSDISSTPEQPFLCFLRRNQGDLIIGQHKVGGSAQRRRRGAVLQHGSFLLRQSTSAPELPGIEDLTGRSLGREQWQKLLASQLSERLSLHFYEKGLTEPERQEATSLAQAKYANQAWNQRR